ncbi:hypothetical protein ACOME3_006930 [Neoechinorhynchus agilis]
MSKRSQMNKAFRVAESTETRLPNRGAIGRRTIPKINLKNSIVEGGSNDAVPVKSEPIDGEALNEAASFRSGHKRTFVQSSGVFGGGQSIKTEPQISTFRRSDSGYSRKPIIDAKGPVVAKGKVASQNSFIGYEKIEESVDEDRKEDVKAIADIPSLFQDPEQMIFMQMPAEILRQRDEKGHLGKIKVYKSGKCVVECLNGQRYRFESITSPNSTEAVLIPPQEKQEIISLGLVSQNYLKIVPDNK